MNPNVSAFLDKAHRALDAARLLADASDAAGAINRAYYAAFYAARAALLTVGETPKTHAGTHNRFRVRFVDTGQISAALGKVLPLAFDLRLGADYDALTVFDEAAVIDLLADVDTFVQAGEPLLTS